MLHVNKFSLFLFFPLKLLLVKIKLYCSQSTFVLVIFERLLFITGNLVKMTKGFDSRDS